jgi:hypothetical protein
MGLQEENPMPQSLNVAPTRPFARRTARRLAAGLSLALLGLTAASAASAPPVALAVDAESTVNGVPVACTGIGGDVRADPRWTAYNVRVEFSNSANEYLTDDAISLRDGTGRELLNVSCAGPWILLRLPKGAYRVEGTLLHLPAKPRSARFIAPDHGQLRVVLQFPEI